ncbi:FAD-dependent oxidoreductase, partial [Kibdelosporangium lantanae]
MTNDLDVLVVGAGLGGTSAAMFLARQGIRTMIIERHAGTSPHPRASGQFPRTMELLRIAGVDDRILEAGGTDTTMRIKVAESVRGRVLHSIVEDFGELATAMRVYWTCVVAEVVGFFVGAQVITRVFDRPDLVVVWVVLVVGAHFVPFAAAF